MSEARTVTLTEFLTARLDEDEERVKRGSLGTRTSFHGWHDVDCGTGLGYWGDPTCTCRYVDRVLAEVEAKRRVIADAEESAEQYRVSRSPVDEGRRWAALVAVGQLAAAYSDHEDYDETWRP